MNTTPNPTLPPLRNWTEPQTVARSQLATIITEAAAAGYAVFSMDIQPKGYRLPSDFDQAVIEYSISMLSLMEYSTCQPVRIHKIWRACFNRKFILIWLPTRHQRSTSSSSRTLNI
jgi:hypothetical protein